MTDRVIRMEPMELRVGVEGGTRDSREGRSEEERAWLYVSCGRRAQQSLVPRLVSHGCLGWHDGEPWDGDGRGAGAGRDERRETRDERREMDEMDESRVSARLAAGGGERDAVGSRTLFVCDCGEQTTIKLLPGYGAAVVPLPLYCTATARGQGGQERDVTTSAWGQKQAVAVALWAGPWYGWSNDGWHRNASPEGSGAIRALWQLCLVMDVCAAGGLATDAAWVPTPDGRAGSILTAPTQQRAWKPARSDALPRSCCARRQQHQQHQQQQWAAAIAYSSGLHPARVHLDTGGKSTPQPCCIVPTLSPQSPRPQHRLPFRARPGGSQSR
ncbi:hypothetical protein BCR34DRAFT_308759 [Clohesyomyces aquaticus]|uniref:Uncharacterized protein n=1 Tax=Clohesyomyces aquaticus TaxID=1231657 RepID=A0A1Y1ZQ60_9PLEO|nr:hypothetical protein BCR34DRAFT_308759 [Clohesyomyces aquaticus]